MSGRYTKKTGDGVGELSGEVAIVTGASSGIGVYRATVWLERYTPWPVDRVPARP